METAIHPRGTRGRGGAPNIARNNHWDRGGSGSPDLSQLRGRGRGRGTRRPAGRRFPNQSLRGGAPSASASHNKAPSPDNDEEEEGEEQEQPMDDQETEEIHVVDEDPDFETNEEFEAFYQEVRLVICGYWLGLTFG